MRIISTLRFGEVEIDEKKSLTLDGGLPGLEGFETYAVLQFDESYPIVWLQSLEDAGVCLPVIDSFLAVPDYAFDIDDAEARELQIEGPEDLQIISVVVIPDRIEHMTANLAAPIVINLRTGKAKQIILSGGDYNVRFPVFDGVCRLLREG
jgi:flagellar assembly factor FliW